MGQPATSPNLQFVDASGDPTDVPREWERSTLEVGIAPAEWPGTQLRLQGELFSNAKATPSWRDTVSIEWPRSGPGNYLIELEASSGSASMSFTILSEKLSEDAVARTIDALESGLPTSIAIGLQRLGGMQGIRLLPRRESTLAQEILRLRRAVRGTSRRPGLAQTLRSISRDPHQIFRSDDVWMRADRVRRPQPARLALAVAAAGNVSEDRTLRRLIDQRVEHTTDVYENRLLKTFVAEVAGRLRRLLRLLAEVRDRRDREEAFTQLSELNTELRSSERAATFLTEVSTPRDLPIVLTMVLLNRPEYRAVLDRLVEFRRSVAVHLEDAALDAPLQNLPHLYQRWCLLQVIDAMTHVAGEQGYRFVEERLSRRRQGALFIDVLPTGPLVRYRHDESGTEATLTHERTFNGQSSPWSVSFTQRPDIVLEVRSRDSVPRLWVFDPKYKLDSEGLDEEGLAGSPKKTDIDKMHTYRDAIIGENGKPAVEYAAILYPGPSHHFGGNIAALQAVGGREARLRVELDAVLARALTTSAP